MDPTLSRNGTRISDNLMQRLYPLWFIALESIQTRCLELDRVLYEGAHIHFLSQLSPETS